MFIQDILPAARARLAVIRHDAPLMDAARHLAQATINLVVVCNEDDALFGLITKTDIVRQISHCQGSSCTTPASAVMTRQLTACAPGDRLADAWSIMKDRGLKHMPVIDAKSRPLGVLYARDALQELLKEVQDEELLLRDYVMGMGYR